MPDNHIANIRSLVLKSGYKDKTEVIPLPGSGSNRQYYRVKFGSQNDPSTLIASYNEDINENIAYNSYTSHFKSLGYNVPKIYARDDTYRYFLIQDLGDITLMDILNSDKELAYELYDDVIDDLLKFQIQGITDLDLDVAYPVKYFDRRSIMWDLNYFKYYFIKPHNIQFNENKLEDDFESFTSQLLLSDCNYFNYRDFQARNIMYHDNKLWYIDFQGGRKGPLQYDLVSLLNQVKAKLPEKVKSKLYDDYENKLYEILPNQRHIFHEHYLYYEYFRLMQVMGAYGFRGKVQGKGHFLQSISPSIEALRKLLSSSMIDPKYKELKNIFDQIVQIQDYREEEDTPSGLTISINSFSYKKKGIPIDTTGNGGGHVFDCRSLPNPGRSAELRDYTGKDVQIINYLESKTEMMDFIENVKRILNPSVDNYILRNFDNLQINFGCTGGRHRSVYSTETIGSYLQNKYPEANIVISHNELD